MQNGVDHRQVPTSQVSLVNHHQVSEVAIQCCELQTITVSITMAKDKNSTIIKERFFLFIVVTSSLLVLFLDSSTAAADEVVVVATLSQSLQDDFGFEMLYFIVTRWHFSFQILLTLQGGYGWILLLKTACRSSDLKLVRRGALGIWSLLMPLQTWSFIRNVRPMNC